MNIIALDDEKLAMEGIYNQARHRGQGQGAAAKAAFHGEYMSQYSWGEDRISILEEEKCRK